ncbi:MAG: low molecular weight protein-tyrosine-phosphatase [Saprospiraceae bacterium]
MKILMICLGNICRSPMAEGVMKHLLKKDSRHDWEVDSAGTGDWHVGQLPDRRAIRTSKNHGIDITRQRARQFNKNDFERFDHLLVMDTENLKDVRNLANNQPDKEKVKLLLEFKYPGKQMIVPDPYFNELFEESFQLIYEGCEAFLEEFG